MKKNIVRNIALYALLITFSCKQDVMIPEEVIVPDDTSCATASKGSADFTKYVAIGSSYTAGFQAGALFTTGQNNSLPAILNKSFQCVGAPATFNQPNINSTLGYNIFISPNPDAAGHIFGRFLLQGASPKPTPQLADVAALPNPGVNPGFLYTGSKASLNNFGIQAIVLGQALIPETGKWAGAGVDPRFNPFYGRLSYPGGSSTLLGDVAAAGGSFFTFWLGMDDFMLYAAYGGDSKLAPLTSNAAFTGQYNFAVGTLLSTNPNLKGAVANFPDIFVMPHFTAVSYNPIPLDAATAGAVSAGFAGYNLALDGLVANAAAFGITDALKAQILTRKVTFTATTNNTPLLIDQSLANLGPYFDGLKAAGQLTDAQRSALKPYQQVRQTTPSDILPLATGSILGTTVGGNPLLVNGVSVPLADRYVITPVERDSINNARASFNATVAAVAAANSSRVALVDVDAGMKTFVTQQAAVLNAVTLTPKIDPPSGIYSEDGLHPNSRGYAFIGTFFVQAINATFGASIPLPNVALYSATALPIP
jgi:lysophospholipase L1-like esterase